VKGYDATILEALTRHRLRIVSKSSNANTITHFVDASLKAVRRAERQIAEAYPSARIGTRRVALVSVIGRNIAGLEVMQKGLGALSEAGIVPLALQQGSRAVDAQFVVPAEAQLDAIRALHRALVEEADETPQAGAPAIPRLVRAA
jgi:aspartate kinase